MRDDDQKSPVNDKPDEPPARRPWAPPRLVPLDIASTEQVDDPVFPPSS